MNTVAIDSKLNQLFAGKVVRKDLTHQLKGNAVVPSYVLEYLLGQYCATDDDETIEQGLDTVREILSRHYVHRDEAELVKATIRDKGIHKVIDKVEATLNEKKDCYEATFSNLGVRQAVIDDDTVRKHEKLLTGGVWCIVDLGYLYTEDKTSSPWIIDRLKPIQISYVDLEEYKALRQEFTTDEWLDVLMQSLGLNPEHFTRRAKLMQMARLVPFCENNYNLIELGPKGTGKSHVFSEFSPHGILLSGGDVTQAKLFVNNASGKIGLVGFWDTVAFDEFAGKDKRVDKKLVDIMKNYMANKTFSRGRDIYGATASMAFVGNTSRSVPYMLKHSHLFEALPPGYLDPAFLDRIHCYLPGWEVNKLRGEMLTQGYGFIVDYLAEVFKGLRKEDYAHLIKDEFKLSATLTSRDRAGVLKTFSGLMKLIFPHQVYSKEEAQEILEFSMESRCRVKQQLYKIDDTFEQVTFSLTDLSTQRNIHVQTLEDEEFRTQTGDIELTARPSDEGLRLSATQATPKLEPKTVKIKENQSGVTYQGLMGDYFVGATEVVIRDPYIRRSHQGQNLLDLLKVIIHQKPKGEEVSVKVVTAFRFGEERQSRMMLSQIGEAVQAAGIQMEYEFEDSDNFHARTIEIDNGWKIHLERGLDIFQAPDRENPFDLGWSLQSFKRSKGSIITFYRQENEKPLHTESKRGE